MGGKVCINRERRSDGKLYCKTNGGAKRPPRPISEGSPCDKWHRGESATPAAGKYCFKSYEEGTLDDILFGGEHDGY